MMGEKEGKKEEWERKRLRLGKNKEDRNNKEGEKIRRREKNKEEGEK